MRLLGCIVAIGGLARLISLAVNGKPGIEHQLALSMELGVVPVLTIWQARLARRWRTRDGHGQEKI